MIALAFYLSREHEATPQSQQQEPVALHSVAVLPFRNLAQTSNEDYLVDGLTDELTTILARNTSLRVISQRSAMRYKGEQDSLQEIARSLNVDVVVEGSYLHADKRIRITVQLIDAHNDQHLWAQMYDESDKHLLRHAGPGHERHCSTDRDCAGEQVHPVPAGVVNPHAA